MTWLAAMSSPSDVEQWRSAVSLTLCVTVSPQETDWPTVGLPAAPNGQDERDCRHREDDRRRGLHRTANLAEAEA